MTYAEHEGRRLEPEDPEIWVNMEPVGESTEPELDHGKLPNAYLVNLEEPQPEKPKEVTVTLKKSHIGILAVVFLILTGVPIANEIWFAADGNDATPTWTEMITDHVPWELALFVYSGLAIWVPVHFIRNYRARANRK